MRVATMEVWLDPVLRPGPEAMAVDEWLHEACETPVLRVYRWEGKWGSLGYFGRLAEARAAVPGVEWVRRWTGGGIVDHRADWTYTLVFPAGCRVSELRGGESYRAIHEALSGALAELGFSSRLSGGEAENGGALCFRNPVRHDLLDAAGGKRAGAGQRRSRRGLLHQGSVAISVDAGASESLALAFAGRLAEEVGRVAMVPDAADVCRRVRERYGSAGWTSRR